MSQITDFYMSWLGCSAFGANQTRLKDQEPLIFKPTDISGCKIWMDATDNDAVQYNDLLLVSSWSNKGTLGGSFDASGAGIVSYGTAQQNGFNTVTFDNYGYLSGVFNMDFQARSVFYVIRANNIIDGSANSVMTSDTTGHQETFFIKDGTWLSVEGKHPSPIPQQAFESTTDYTGYAYLTEFIVGSDLSDNWCGYNGTYIPPIYQTTATYTQGSATYFLGNFFNGTPLLGNIDFCELIVYEGALSIADREQVETYLRFRWNFVEPPTPPTPFVPTDISGLYIWQDATQGILTDASGTNVLSWANQGLAGNGYTPGCNGPPQLYVDKNGYTFIEFPSSATMDTYIDLPYCSRTAFTVFKNLTPLDTISYPYINLIGCDVETGRQLGVNYDSNTSNYQMAMCQQGQNCPAIAQIPLLGTGDTHLAIWGCLSNTIASNTCYWDGGSNINLGTDVGNLFSQNPIPYYIGSPNYDSPSFQVAEILEYNDLLSPTQISTVANYLVTKWAISSFSTIV